MGGGGSKQQSQTVISNETINETTKNIVNSSINRQELKTVTQQNMSIEGIDFVSCRGSIAQNMDLSIKVMQTFSGQDSTNLVNDIMNSLDSQVQEQASSEAGFGDILSGGSENDSYTEIRNSIHNKLTSNITNEFINEQSSKVATSQGLVIKDVTMDPLGFNTLLKISLALIEAGFPEMGKEVAPTVEMMLIAKDTHCPITQDLAIDYTAQQVASKVSEIINTDKAANDLKNKLEKESTSKTQGAGEAVADAAEGIGAGVSDAAQGVGAGVGDAAEGVGTGVGDAAQGIGAGIGAAMAGPFIPFAISSSSMMAAGMVMMMMSKGGGGMDPAMMAALMKR